MDRCDHIHSPHHTTPHHTVHHRRTEGKNFLIQLSINLHYWNGPPTWLSQNAETNVVNARDIYHNIAERAERHQVVKNVCVSTAPRDPPDIIIVWRRHFSCDTVHQTNTTTTSRLSKNKIKNHDFLVSSSCWSFCDNYLLIFPDLMITLELLMRFPSGMERCWSALFFYLSENYPAPISLRLDLKRIKQTISISIFLCLLSWSVYFFPGRTGACGLKTCLLI